MAWPVGRFADGLRRQLDLPTLTVVAPDVGGLGLCCESLRVIDLGLLTHRGLARDGYRALPRVLERERPDLIVTHAAWTRVSRIDAWSGLAAYVPIVVPATLGRARTFLLREDHAERLSASRSRTETDGVTR